MNIKLDENYNIELPEQAKGLRVLRNWDVFSEKYTYTIEFYIDKNVYIDNILESDDACQLL